MPATRTVPLRCRVQFASHEFAEVRVEHIGLNDCHIGKGASLEGRCQIAIDFHREQFGDPLSQRTGNCSMAWANLEKAVSGRRGDCGDKLGDPHGFEKVLAEALPRLHEDGSPSNASPRQYRSSMSMISSSLKPK